MNNRIKIPATRTTRPTAIRMVVNDTRDASGTERQFRTGSADDAGSAATSGTISDRCPPCR